MLWSKCSLFSCSVTVRFTKLLTNCFRSSFEIPEVRYELRNLRSCQSNRELWNEVVNFTLNFMWKLRSLLWQRFLPFSVVTVVGLVHLEQIVTNESLTGLGIAFPWTEMRFNCCNCKSNKFKSYVDQQCCCSFRNVFFRPLISPSGYKPPPPRL